MEAPKEESLLNIVYEDSELLLVNKPAGLVCHPTKSDCLSSLIARLRIHLGSCPLRQNPRQCVWRAGGPCGWSVKEEGAPEIHLIHRLDRETSGIVLAAKNGTAARTLGFLLQQGKFTKTYLAIVYGVPSPASGTIHQPLGKDLQSPVVIKDCVRSDGAPAQTRYSLLHTFQKEGQTFSLLELTPLTGRKHQIRIHLAWIGTPIVGDKLYGLDERYYLDLVEGRLSGQQCRELLLPWQALHARSLSYRDNEGNERTFNCDPEKWFLDFAGLESPVALNTLISAKTPLP